ncbi:helix-turn-helix domain-containing protein [Francisella sp. SYW-2]|uniref:helix-turn-helix domain-containing protein n=1 Tax=Francisella sp. SYW-2 TaxID=2610886 RepID=UPI00123D4535|nr:helix-turn-helix domain-containing protein [Francisella sp. SYW-2]
MSNFQEIIRSYREYKGLSITTVADAINIPEETIIIIEQGDSYKITQQPSTILKDRIKRYCEYLNIPKNHITYILNSIDILYYKKAKYGKMKLFDYFNRIAIISISLLIIYLSSNIIEKKIANSHSPNTQSNDKSLNTLATTNYESFIQKSQPLLYSRATDKLPITQKNTVSKQAIDNNIRESDSSSEIIKPQIEKSPDITTKSEKQDNEHNKTVLESQPSTILEQKNQDQSNNIESKNLSPQAQVNNKTYIIKSGDSLYKIAQMVLDKIDNNDDYSNYDLILSIKGLNLKDDPDIINDTIFAGEELNIPTTDEQIKNGIKIYKQYSNN